MGHFPFPNGFLWGTATAAHQVEGNNVNSDHWLMEHVPGTIYAEPSGDACDHYHRYPEDIALLAELGFNMYRFSIEWARIEPEEGEFSKASLEHYRRMLATCHEHGLTPMVTFHHFTSPRWLIAAGGWEDKDTPEALEATIRCAASVTGIPVIVTENGIATADDTRRIEYIQRALQGVANCLKDGLDVRGYIYWSALDNFEWMQGYRPTFGLIAVDRETQKRTVKPSARWLGAVARANRLPISQS